MDDVVSEECKIQEFLRDLAERLMAVPVTYGTDQFDVDRLNNAASKIDDLERLSGKVAGRI